MNIKNLRISAICVALFLSLSSISLGQNITNKMDSVSYSVGVIFAKSIKQQGIDKINVEVVAQAITDYLNGETRVIPENECRQMFSDYLKVVNKAKEAKTKAASKAYLAENMKNPNVVVTESGLQYEVLVSGTGSKPTDSNTVKTHYHGMLINGEVFDSSVDRGDPISFPVNNVIKGWQEALKLMSVGDKWRLVIPSELAYGVKGAAKGLIPPHAALVFEIELLGIE